jgi:ribonuclease HI
VASVVPSPPQYVHLYTDGSSLSNSNTNPGGTGAGIYVDAKDSNGQQIEMHYRYTLEPGTNSFAELSAIELATEVLDDVAQELAQRGNNLIGVNVMVRTDSKFALNMLYNRYKPKDKFEQLVPAIQAKLLAAERRHQCKILLDKVQAHRGIAGNEAADALAADAAQAHVDGRGAVCGRIAMGTAAIAGGPAAAGPRGMVGKGTGNS